MEARHGADRTGRSGVLTGLVYLRGTCPVTALDMTLPNGAGTRHEALVWNVERDNAAATLEAVATGRERWGALFWVPLMAGGDTPEVLEAWRREAGRVENARVRADLAQIALIFAELAGRLALWSDALKEWNMVESQVFQQMTAKAEQRGKAAGQREILLLILRERFREPLPAEFASLINSQDSDAVLQDWVRACVRANTLEEFLAVLRQ